MAIGPPQYAPTVTYVNQPPSTPTATGATNVGQEQADLNGDAYSDPDGDPHASTDWQVRQQGDADWTSPVFESLQDTTNLETITATGLPEGTGLEYRLRYRDDQGNVSDWSNVSQFTTTSVAPTLSNPTGTATGETTADGSVDTDEGDGTLYWVVTTSSTAPTVAQVQAGQDESGAAAAASGNQAVSSTGTQNVSASGLDAGTQYWFHFQQQDEVGNDSTVVTSSSFTTSATVDVVAVDLPHLEVWSDLECAGGARLSSIPDVLDVEVEEALEQKDEKGQDRLRVTLPRSADAWNEINQRGVIRLEDGGDVREWRVRDENEREDADGRLVGEVVGEGVLYDLGYRTEVLRRSEANGRVDPRFEVNQHTPAEHLDIILGELAPYTSGAPSYFSAGTIEPTDPVDMVYDWDTPLSALRELLRRISGTAELQVRRNGSSGYLIDIVRQIGAAADTVWFAPGRNARQVRRQETAKDQGTRVHPRGADIAGAAATMASHAWRIASISTNTITFEDEILTEDGQLTGFYAEAPDGTLLEVTASTAPDQVTVTDASGLGAGDRITFREDAQGTELTYLESPSAVSSYGQIPKVIDRQDIPPIDVLNPNPYLDAWTSGLPDGTASVGAPTIQESTDPQFARHGGTSAHITADEGEGIAMAAVDVDPKEDRPFFTGQAALWLVSGSVRIELVDVTNAKTWPPGEAQDSEITTRTGEWVERLGIRPGENFFETGTTQLHVQLIAQEDGTELYLDAWMLTQTEGGVETYYHSRGSNDLWFSALDELTLHAEPIETYRVEARDLTRLDPDKWPDEELVLGADVRVRAPDLALDVASRIVARRWDPLDPRDLHVELETEEERLSRFLARTRRRRRERKPPRPPQVNRPDPITGASGSYGTLLKATWDPSRGALRYDWRKQGTGSTPVERWENGTRLVNTDGTEFTRAGLTDDPIELVGRAISPTGKPQRGAVELSLDKDVTDDEVDTTPRASISPQRTDGEVLQDVLIEATPGPDGSSDLEVQYRTDDVLNGKGAWSDWETTPHTAKVFRGIRQGTTVVARARDVGVTGNPVSDEVSVTLDTVEIDIPGPERGPLEDDYGRGGIAGEVPGGQTLKTPMHSGDGQQLVSSQASRIRSAITIDPGVRADDGARVGPSAKITEQGRHKHADPINYAQNYGSVPLWRPASGGYRTKHPDLTEPAEPIITIENHSKSGGTLKAIVKELPTSPTAVSTPFSADTHGSVGINDDDYSADKEDASDSSDAWDDSYTAVGSITAHGDINCIGGDCWEVGGSFEVGFYVNEGGGPVLQGTESHSASGSDDTKSFSIEASVAALGTHSGKEFWMGVEGSSGQGGSYSPNEVQWEVGGGGEAQRDATTDMPGVKWFAYSKED